jgi:hypothetical protein
MSELHESFGKPDDWRCKTVDGITTFLRVTDFANSEDARLFNEWCERGYRLQKGCKDEPKRH